MKASFDSLETLVVAGQAPQMSDSPDSAVRYVSEVPFFVKPTLNAMNDFSGHSSVVLIAAPGATGKSTFGEYLAYRRNAVYWDLAHANIGDNYFLGTLTRTFGAKSLAHVVDLISTGQMAFVFDAFDEAEMSNGWNKVQEFIKEVLSFSSKDVSASYIFLSRYETSQYISLVLDDLLGEATYHYFGIDFFEKKEAGEFLLGYVGRLKPSLLIHRDRILQISDMVFDNVETSLGQREGEATSLAGYAPVLQAIATLLSEYSNLQEFEREYSDATRYDRFIETVVINILKREQQKVVTALKARLDSKAIQSGDLSWAYEVEEQLFRVLCFVLTGKTGFDIHQPNTTQQILAEYKELTSQFLPQHPFVKGVTEFTSPAFRDYTIALLLAKQNQDDFIMGRLDQVYPRITPLFWRFYLSSRTSGSILGDHIGLMCHSILSGKHENTEAIVAIHDTEVGTAITTSIDIWAYGTDQTKTVPIDVSSNRGLYFPYHLQGIGIVSSKKLTLGVAGGDFLVSDASVRVDEIEVLARHFIVRCDELDKPVELIARDGLLHKDGLRLTVVGSGYFICSWPNGRVYPWVQHQVTLSEVETVNVTNLLLSMRQILKWFRKDRRDSIARYADFITNIAVNGNNLNRRMLDYLLRTGVLWQDRGLFKLNHEVAEQNGINFNALKSLELNARLATFVEAFV